MTVTDSRHKSARVEYSICKRFGGLWNHWIGSSYPYKKLANNLVAKKICQYNALPGILPLPGIY